MKRIISFLLVVALITTCIAGCSSKKTAEAPSTVEETTVVEDTTEVEETVKAEETSAAIESANTETEKVTDNDAVINGIVDHFMPLTTIPRQSHHEEQISDYLYSWAEERGFAPVKDSANNIVFDVPGTEGMEDAPITILQGHMDMVIAVADGKSFDPQKDAITVINDGETLKADGTSLGADDGMGIAMILYAIENNKSHGPLRIIVTTNEEDGMTGAFALTTDSIGDAKYVINLDSENTKEVTNSSAAGVIVNFSYEPEKTAPQKTIPLEISVTGLASGHSGIDIDKGRINGIKMITAFLNLLDYDRVDFELASIEGGSANNAIPGKASTIIVIDAEDEAEVMTTVDNFKKVITMIYGGIEKDLEFKSATCTMPEAVFSKASRNDVLGFVGYTYDGLFTMSKQVAGLVESSSNLGLISMSANKEGKSTASAYIRSSDPENLEFLVNDQLDLAKECHFEATPTTTADPWPVKPDSKLLEMIKDAYLDITGTEITVVQLHAGLETGTFSKLNPDLDIVSIGIDVKDPHTINETCLLKTLPTTYGMLEKVLAQIGSER